MISIWVRPALIWATNLSKTTRTNLNFLRKEGFTKDKALCLNIATCKITIQLVFSKNYKDCFPNIKTTPGRKCGVWEREGSS